MGQMVKERTLRKTVVKRTECKGAVSDAQTRETGYDGVTSWEEAITNDGSVHGVVAFVACSAATRT